MTRLFILVYLGVLGVLIAAWYIHGQVSEAHTRSDRNRVVEAAHGGGARLVADELNAVPAADRQSVLKRLQVRFSYPIKIVARSKIPPQVERRFRRGDDVVFWEKEGEGSVLFTSLAGGADVLRLGSFPGPGVKYIEEGLGGGLRVAAAKLSEVSESERPELLAVLQKRFDYPIEVAAVEKLPKEARNRIRAGDDVVLYSDGDRAHIATRIAGGTQVAHFGPFPNYQRVEQKALTTTLALVLLLAALAIALILSPVARQLRRVEHAAKAIAAGDLSARVDENRVKSARALARAFNNMAGRTESLVRTQRELLQAVSHELRTPLSRMRFAIDLIESAEDDATRRQRLDSLDAATQELDDLVGELLTYVRMETGEPDQQREPVSLTEVMQEMLPKYAMVHPSIDFVIDDGSADGQTIPAHLTGVQRVLGNLLSNAGRYAKSRVSVRAARDNGMVTLDVDDDGEGIPSGDRARVLEPFVRAENAGTGVGLGLALVKRIVQQHGGEVEVHTSPQGGCRIRTKWPVEQQATGQSGA